MLLGGPAGDGVDGGPGPDLLYGRIGPDDLVPGPGRDRLNAGQGNDQVILKHDHRPDVAKCGPGVDQVYFVERRDPADAFIGCERVQVVG